jgi:hypothetical protein
MKRPVWIIVAVTAAFGAGWLAGGSGRSAAEVAAGRSAQLADFLHARALVLEGQLRLTEFNFGEAGARFGEAGEVVERLQRRLRETGLAERAGLLEVALGYLEEAGERAAALDTDAGSAAEAALRTIDTVNGM